MSDKPIWTAANLWSARPEQQTQMDWVYASTLISVTERVKNENTARVAQYENAYSQYAAAMDNHPELASSQVPPVPPFAMKVVVDQNGWATEEQSTERVCPTKNYVPAPKPELGTGKIGKLIFAPDWFECLPGDTTPNGTVIPGVSKDGVPGLFQKVASPIQASGAGSGNVQVLGWYQKKG